jgi:DNA-binding transcriptional LysR family regulator
MGEAIEKVFSRTLVIRTIWSPMNGSHSYWRGGAGAANADFGSRYAREVWSMELSWLDDFLVLARCANFSRAAELRHTTQPAFSRRIRTLEEWLGTTLFDRTHQPVALTEAGLRFLPAARETLLRLNQAREECREIGHSASATLHFAATHSLSLTFFPGWLRALESGGPFGAIRLTSDSLQACEQIMLNSQAQFLLCHCRSGSPDLLDAEFFQSVEVGRDVLAPLIAPGHAASSLGLPGHLDHPLPLLAYSPESGLGRILADAGKSQAQLPWLEPVFTSHLAVVLRSMALEGRGLAWLPLSLVKDDLQCGALVHAGDSTWDVDVEIRLFRPRAALAPAAERFWALLGSGK